jgi:hypothetical protein
MAITINQSSICSLMKEPYSNLRDTLKDHVSNRFEYLVMELQKRGVNLHSRRDDDQCQGEPYPQLNVESRHGYRELKLYSFS